MEGFAEIAAQGHEAILRADYARVSALIDENFDTRAGIARLPDWQVNMVTTARACGASAKFAGSGGAIIGLYDGEAMFADLHHRLAEIGSRVIKPQVFPV
jgi:glucuronokinase